MSTFQQRLVQIATAELRLWREAGLVECVRSPTTGKPLAGASQTGANEVAKYWRGGIGDMQRTGCDGVAWSATFICWCMRQAGMKLDDFPFNSGHWAYIRWAIRNTALNKPGKSYYGRRVTEYSPQPGDLIAQWRKNKTTDPDPDVTSITSPTGSTVPIATSSSRPTRIKWSPWAATYRIGCRQRRSQRQGVSSTPGKSGSASCNAASTQPRDRTVTVQSPLRAHNTTQRLAT